VIDGILCYGKVPAIRDIHATVLLSWPVNHLFPAKDGDDEECGEKITDLVS